MKFYHLLSAVAFLLLSVFAAGAQNTQPQSEEEQEKQLLEYIDKRKEKLTTLLNLEYWQEFYVDSILTHDVMAMMEEQKKLQAAKAENPDLYQGIVDKWEQQIDDSFKRYFTEDQWKKYWKTGAERAWKARQKRKK